MDIKEILKRFTRPTVSDDIKKTVVSKVVDTIRPAWRKYMNGFGGIMKYYGENAPLGKLVSGVAKGQPVGQALKGAYNKVDIGNIGGFRDFQQGTDPSIPQDQRVAALNRSTGKVLTVAGIVGSDLPAKAGLNKLLSEARKYKTAEEAVGSGKFLVRGVSGRTAKNPLGLEGGVWATDNFELATTFGDTLEVVPKPKKILQSDVFELADMVGKTEPGEMTAQNWAKIRTDLRSQGYDAVNLGQGHMDNANDFWLLDEKTQRIPTSLWEQAQKVIRKAGKK